MVIIFLAVTLFTLSAFATSGAVSATGTADITPDKTSLKVTADKEATDWTSEATPMGNGFLGAMIYGGVSDDHIQLNEHTLWSGGPGADADYNGGHRTDMTPTEIKAALQHVRAGLQELMIEFSEEKQAYIDSNGKVVTANYPNLPKDVNDALLKLRGEKEHFGRYQTFGDLHITDTMIAVLRNVTSNGEGTDSKAGPEMLFDGNSATKWYSIAGLPGDAVQEGPAWVTAEYNKARSISSYKITSGNDMPARDPKNWKIYGSTDGTNFVQIDEQTNVSFETRKQTKTFTLATASDPYKFFKMEVSEIQNGSWAPGVGLQMSDLTYIDSIEGSNEITAYSRELDLDNSVTTVKYAQGGVNYEREYFISNPGNFMAVRMTADGDAKLNREISFSSPQTNIEVTAQDDKLTVTGSPADHVETERLKFAGQLKAVLPEGGTVAASEDKLNINDAGEIILYWSAGTNYQQCMDNSFDYFTDADPLTAVAERVEAAAAQLYADHKAAHTADYKELFDRVSLNFTGATVPSKSTAALLSGYRAKTNTETENRYLEILYYQFGRYLMIASSREGSLPANLQGIWCNELTPRWESDYHTNINVNMNYWMAESANLSECHTPLIEYTNSLVPRGEITAQTYHCTEDGKDVRGWTIYHENNIWGNSAPSNYITKNSAAFYFPAAAAWLCQDIWEKYAFTCDKDFLQKNFKTLLGASLFWVDNLVTDSRDGTLVVSPSHSPEHGPFSLGATGDQMMVWDLFNNTLEAAEILGIQSSEINEIRASMEKLSKPKIGLGGQLQEWKDETTMDITGDNGYLHVMHLFALMPGRQIVPGRSEKDDEFADAVRKTLEVRNAGKGGKGIGWSTAWKVNLYARLLDSKSSYDMLNNLLANTTFDNLFDRVYDIFQIDGNFGGTAGITEMLLQSHAGYISPVPALPDQWNSGSYTGLRARGGFEIDARWNDGALNKMVVRSDSGKDCNIRYPYISGAKVYCDGVEISFKKIDSDTIRFATEKGKEYVVESIPGQPAAVQGLTAHRNGSVQLTWQPVPDAVEYRVYRSYNGGEVTMIATVNATSYEDATALSQNIDDAYSYYVIAFGNGGIEGKQGESVSVSNNILYGKNFRIIQGALISDSYHAGYLTDGIKTGVGAQNHRVALKARPKQYVLELEVDLGTVQNIARVDLFELNTAANNGQRIDNFDVLAYDSESGEWRKIATAATPIKWTFDETEEVAYWQVEFQETQTQKLKIICNDAQGSGMSVWEIQAFDSNWVTSPSDA